MAWTFCLSGEAISKAGAHANAIVVVSGTALHEWSNQAEGDMEMETGMTLLDSYSGFATGIKGALADVSSSKIAMKIIAYDTTGYLSREADTLLNFNDDVVTKKMPELKDHKKYTLNTP